MWKTRVQSLGGEDPLEKEMEPTPVFLPGKSHEQRSLTGCCPWDCKELDTTEHAHTSFHDRIKINNLLVPYTFLGILHVCEIQKSGYFWPFVIKDPVKEASMCLSHFIYLS